MRKLLFVLLFVGILMVTGCGKIRHSRRHISPSHPQIRHRNYYVRPYHRPAYHRPPVRHGSRPSHGRK